MEPLTIEIKPLTPIWTGDANRECKTLKETGIIGSLRWWYEAILRGMGIYACDPSDSKCDEKAHCDACHIFGCTGWGRSFSLEITPKENRYAPFLIIKPPGSRKQSFLGYYNRNGRGYENNGGILAENTIKIHFLKEVTPNILKLLFKLSADWGIGARTQTGFGIAQISPHSSPVKEFPISPKKPKEVAYSLPLPRIDQFFFSIIPLKKGADGVLRTEVSKHLFKTMDDIRTKKPISFSQKYSYIPSAPWVRKALRSLWKDNDILRHYLMGFVSVRGNPQVIHIECFTHSCIKDRNNEKHWYCRICNRGNLKDNDVIEKIGSKIYVSHCYKTLCGSWEMKIWGWIPELSESKRGDVFHKTRKEVLSEIKSSIKKEEFWKKCFKLSNCIVDVQNIKWIEDISPEEILYRGGNIFNREEGV